MQCPRIAHPATARHCWLVAATASSGRSLSPGTPPVTSQTSVEPRHHRRRLESITRTRHRSRCRVGKVAKPAELALRWRARSRSSDMSPASGAVLNHVARPTLPRPPSCSARSHRLGGFVLVQYSATSSHWRDAAQRRVRLTRRSACDRAPVHRSARSHVRRGAAGRRARLKACVIP